VFEEVWYINYLDWSHNCVRASSRTPPTCLS